MPVPYEAKSVSYARRAGVDGDRKVVDMSISDMAQPAKEEVPPDRATFNAGQKRCETIYAIARGLVAFGLIGMVVVTIVWNKLPIKPVIAGAVVATIFLAGVATLLIGVYSSSLLKNAFYMLRGEYYDLSNTLKDTKERQREADSFIRTFRPLQEFVDGVLTELAVNYAHACQLQVDLYATGLKPSHVECDSEYSGRDLEKLHYAEAENRKTHVAGTKKAFWDALTLAGRWGYKVRNSYKDYLPSQDGVDGMNEQPGQ